MFAWLFQIHTYKCSTRILSCCCITRSWLANRYRLARAGSLASDVPTDNPVRQNWRGERQRDGEKDWRGREVPFVKRNPARFRICRLTTEDPKSPLCARSYVEIFIIFMEKTTLLQIASDG